MAKQSRACAEQKAGRPPSPPPPELRGGQGRSLTKQLMKPKPQVFSTFPALKAIPEQSTQLYYSVYIQQTRITPFDRSYASLHQPRVLLLYLITPNINTLSNRI